MNEIKNVSLIGLGAIGCSVLPYLSAVLPRENLLVIAAGARKERLERNGVTINEKSYHPFIVGPEETSHRTDLVIIAVKDTQLKQAIADLKNYVGESTIILSLMNGITSEDEIASVYGAEKVLYSLTTINSAYKDGKATFTANACGIKFGEKENTVLSEKVRAVKALFDQAGIGYEIPQNMVKELWYKFLLNVSGNTVAALLHARHIYFQKIESANKARECIVREVVALSKAMGTGLTEEDIVKIRDAYKIYPPYACGSMVQDIEAGRQTEIDMLAGTVVRLGQEYQVDTPVTEFVYYLISTINQVNAGVLKNQ